MLNIKKFLEKILKENFDYGPTVILTHHRIWDDTLISDKSYSHDKSFYFDEIFPVLDGKIKAIFSGNSKRQYFRDLTDDGLSYGKQNVNLIYWLDKIKNIEQTILKNFTDQDNLDLNNIYEVMEEDEELQIKNLKDQKSKIEGIEKDIEELKNSSNLGEIVKKHQKIVEELK